MKNKKLTPKQKAFAECYIETNNAVQSALKAGYTKAYANAQSYLLLENVGIKSYIDKKMLELSSKRIAKAEEVLEHLTSIMRGEISEEVVVVEGTGDGHSEARTVNKDSLVKDRLRAAELLGKRYRLFTDKVEAEVTQVVVFEGEDQLED